MAYSMEIKNEVKQKLANGEKPKEISEQMGISVPTIYNWKKEFEKQTEQEKEKGIEETENDKRQAVDVPFDPEARKEIKELIKLKQFNKMFELAKKYPDDPIIQVQVIKKLISKYEKTDEIEIREKYLEEAKRIGKREKCIDNYQIQLQMINIAIEEGDLKEAKRIGKREKFINDYDIQLQMIKIAIEEGDLEEAKRIGKREKFIDNSQIQLQMKKIDEKEKGIETETQVQEESNRKEKNLWIGSKQCCIMIE